MLDDRLCSSLFASSYFVSSSEKLADMDEKTSQFGMIFIRKLIFCLAARNSFGTEKYVSMNSESYQAVVDY